VAAACAQLAAADVLLRLAPGTDEGATRITQGLLVRDYGGGAYAAEAERLERSARELLAPFVRVWV
jgi:hypothetical protein